MKNHPKDKSTQNAILLKITSSALYAVSNGMTKYLTGIGIHNLLFLQNFFSVLFISIYIIIKKIPLKTDLIHLHCFRGIIYTIATLFWFKSVIFLPITTVVMIGFAGPIFTIIGGMIFLNEKLTIHRFIAIAIAFTGSACIINSKLSGTFLVDVILFFPIFANIGYSCCNILSKKLAQDSSTIVVFYTLIFSLIPIGIIIGFDIPSINNLHYILLMSLISVTAYVFMNQAIKLKGVILLIPFGLMRQLLTCAIGVLIFDEILSHWQIIGGLLMISAMIYANKYEK